MPTTLDVECPGCGRPLAIKGDRPITVEWQVFSGHRGFGGNVVAECEHLNDVPNITVDDDIIDRWTVHQETVDRLGYVGHFHECWNGDGDSNIRAVVAPAPPPLVASIAIEPLESA